MTCTNSDIAMRISFFPAVTALLAMLFTILASAGSAQAIQLSPIQNPTVQKECSACHIAYPPQMLPQRSWKAILGDLSNHFGEDASLPKKETAEIAHYLMGMAADSPTDREGRVFLRGLPSSQTPLKITDLPIWRLIHGDPNQRVFKRKDITSAANCGACHYGADRGRFSGE